MAKKSFILALAVNALFSTATLADVPNSPAGQNTFTLNIRGFVPVICRASVGATQVSAQAGQVSLGQLSEFCNDPNGYQVWVDYSPQLSDAYLLVDGNRVNLSSSGSTQITDSSGPSVEAHDLTLNLPQGGVQGSFSIRVVAL